MARRAPPPPTLSEEALRLVAARFRVLGDPGRLGILNRLMQGESSVGELVDATQLEQPTVSRHLAVLRREGIVSRRSEGNRGIYRIEDPTVTKLCAIACGSLAEQLSGELDALPESSAWRGSGI